MIQAHGTASARSIDRSIDWPITAMQAQRAVRSAVAWGVPTNESVTTLGLRVLAMRCRRTRTANAKQRGPRLEGSSFCVWFFSFLHSTPIKAQQQASTTPSLAPHKEAGLACLLDGCWFFYYSIIIHLPSVVFGRLINLFCYMLVFVMCVSKVAAAITPTTYYERGEGGQERGAHCPSPFPTPPHPSPLSSPLCLF